MKSDGVITASYLQKDKGKAIGKIYTTYQAVEKS
jgi:hypothetical protein